MLGVIFIGTKISCLYQGKTKYSEINMHTEDFQKISRNLGIIVPFSHLKKPVVDRNNANFRKIRHAKAKILLEDRSCIGRKCDTSSIQWVKEKFPQRQRRIYSRGIQPVLQV